MDAVAVNLFSVKSIALSISEGAERTSDWPDSLPLRWIRIGVEERAERHPSIQPERDPAAPRRTSGTGQNRGSKLSPHPTTHVHVPRDATRASASQGRFQNLTALWFTRAAAGRHMSQAASGRRGFVLPGRERDGGIGGFCFSARTLHRRCTTVPRSTEHKLGFHSTVSVVQPAAARVGNQNGTLRRRHQSRRVHSSTPDTTTTHA